MSKNRPGSRQGRRKQEESEEDVFEERFEVNRRPSLFEAARPASFSTETYNKMLPADKLIFTLHKYFPASDVRAIEEEANEIQHFLYAEHLKEFGDQVRQMTSDLLHSQKLSSRNKVAAAIEALRKEVILVPPPSTHKGSKKASVVKSCLRQSGEVKAQSPGERLAERLEPLLDPKIADVVVCRADNITSKEELDDLIAFLNLQLSQKISADESTAKNDVTLALSNFTEQILLRNAQVKEIQKYMEEMRATVQLLMKDMHLEQDFKTKAFNISKSIEADYNAIEDDEKEAAAKRMAKEIKELTHVMDQMMESVPDKVKAKIQNFEKLSNATLEKL